MAFTCKHCGKEYTRKRDYDVHMTKGKCMKTIKFNCAFCSSVFTRKINKDKHEEKYHTAGNVSFFTCGVCQLCFRTKQTLHDHQARDHGDLNTEFVLRQSAHRFNCEEFRMYFPQNINTVEEGLFYSSERLLSLMEHKLVDKSYYKANVTLFVEMMQLDDDGVSPLKIDTFPFRAEGMHIYPFANISDKVSTAFESIQNQIGEFLVLGSGWIVNQVMWLDLECAKCKPLSGGCGAHEVGYVREKGIVVSNKGFGENQQEVSDDMCFFRAVATHFAPSTNGVAFMKKGLVKNIPTPVKISDITQFEEDNAHLSLAVNVVYQDEEGVILPVRASSKLHASNVVVLLLTYMGADGEIDENGSIQQGHFIYVINPNEIFAERREQKSRKQKIPTHFCWNCMNNFVRFSAYTNHVAVCHTKTGQVMTYPAPGETLQYDFEDHRKEFKVGYTVMFDFETLQITPEKSCSCSHESIAYTKMLEEKEKEERDKNKKLSPRELKNKRDQELLQQIDLEQQKEMNKSLNKKKRKKEEEEDERYATSAKKLHAYDRERKLATNYVNKSAEFVDQAENRPQPELSDETLAFLHDIEKMEQEKKKPTPKRCTHKTKVLKEQHAFAYSWCMVDRHDKLVRYNYYVGDDAADVFVEELMGLEKEFISSLQSPAKMIWRDAIEGRLAETQLECHICSQHMEEGDRYRDHDHISGDFIGMAHDYCNRMRKEQMKIVTFAHNFSGYDSHLLVRALGKRKDVTLSAIPLNTQKFKCLNINRRIQMLDSMGFLPASLQNLVDTLQKSKHDFLKVTQLVNDWTGCTDKKSGVDLLLQKGIYPYGFATSTDILEKTTHLPPKEAFYNDLKDEEVSDADYKHARKVWKMFNIKTMMEYTILYVLSDVFQLAEVVCDMRNAIFSEYNIDLCHYLSLPHMSFDIMLKLTKTEIELMSDTEMIDTLQRSIRGGLSYIGTRYADIAKSSKKLKKPRTAIYFDANNLYGAAMRFPLPQKDMRWMTDEEVTEFNPYTMVTEEEGPGYILIVTMKYPKKLHLKHNSFPLLPEHVEITDDMLSPYSQEALDKTKGLKSDGTRKKYKASKLSATFNTRKEYTIHGLNLLFALQQGLELVKIHSGITFYQVLFRINN